MRPQNCSPNDSSCTWTSQTRMLRGCRFPAPRASSQLWDLTHVSCDAGNSLSLSHQVIYSVSKSYWGCKLFAQSVTYLSLKLEFKYGIIYQSFPFIGSAFYIIFRKSLPIPMWKYLLFPRSFVVLAYAYICNPGSRFIFPPYGYLINPTSFIEAFSLSFLHHSDTFVISHTFVISQVITYVWVSRLCFIDLFVYLWRIIHTTLSTIASDW